MKTIVIYYSYTGSTKKKAMAEASRLGADVYEVADRSRPGKVGAYVRGSLAAMRGKTTPVAPIAVDLSLYEKIVIMAPVWAGYPAPPINHVFTLLPLGAQVEVALVSASGKSSAEDKVRAAVEARRCRLTAYRNLKTDE